MVKGGILYWDEFSAMLRGKDTLIVNYNDPSGSIIPFTTVKLRSLSFISGGKTLIPISSHSLIYLTVWEVAPLSASRDAADVGDHRILHP